MLDRIAALAAAALLSLSSLLHRETAVVGVELVTRSSLTGYDVAGQHGLGIDEAAQVLAERAVAEMDAAAAARPTRPHDDLLTAPHQMLGGRISETWRLGDAANRRLYALRGSEVGRYVTQVLHRGSGLFGSKHKLEITYPAGRSVPAIEVVS